MLEVNRVGGSRVHDEFLKENGLEFLDPECADLPLLRSVESLSLHLLGEHCTECAAPDCHDTCDLFERGPTGFCRRFQDGIVVEKCALYPLHYSVSMLCKRWARLICVGNRNCMSPAVYSFLSHMAMLDSRANVSVQKALRFLPARMQWKISDKIRGACNYIPRFLNRIADGQSEALLLIAGNPHKEAYDVELSLSGFGESQGGRSYRRVVTLKSGWNELSLAVSEFSGIIDLACLHRVCVVPQDDSVRMLQVLYCGYVNYCKAGKSAQKVKLLALDLDNTLWDGILVEKEGENVELFRDVVDVLKELDRRGILLTAVSKNNYDDVGSVLKKLGVWDLLLYPEINWEPKSVNLRKIVDRLNIGIDSAAFIDDSEFERAEVKEALPEVRVFDASELSDLPDMDCFRVPVTADSERRRELYRSESERKGEFDGSDLGFDEFLRSCNMKITLDQYGDANRERVYELVQRTNQLNFSGTHYTRQELDDMLAPENVVPIVISAEDRFGDYGTIGFAILQRSSGEMLIRDMMFSCRIQGKKVEHAFLNHIIKVAGEAGLARCVCNCRRTKRNGHSAVVFSDMGFREDEQGDGLSVYFLECAEMSEQSYPVGIVGNGVATVIS